MKIYTRGGDKGRTSLFTGGRVVKDDARIEALGAVDELVAALGMAKSAASSQARILDAVEQAQTRLYLLMAGIAGSPGSPGEDSQADETQTDDKDDNKAAIEAIEGLIDALDADLPPLSDFVIPGTSPASATLHLARAICRRAERRVLAAARDHAIPGTIITYLNRLSDLLFVMARWVDRQEDAATFKQRLGSE